MQSATFALTNPATVNADGNIGWEFTVDDADLDFLAEGETREFTYTVIIDDSNGGTDTRDVTVTVTGSNDDPVLAAAAETITIPFTANVRPAETYGTIAAGEEFTGFVVIDAASGEAISFEVHHATEGSLTSNTVAINFLDNFGGGANDLIVIQGTNVTGTLGGIVAGAGSIVISLYGDPSIFSGGSVPFDQTIWNSFTDDRLLSLPAPSNPDATTGVGDVEPFPDFVIGGAATGAITELPDGDTDENNYSHSATGTIEFSDVDVSDTHTVSFEAAAGNPTDLVGVSFYVSDPTTTNTTTDGSVDWTFEVPDSSLDFLAEGETREFTYTVTVDDGEGGTASREVIVTVTGTNDAPVVTSETYENVVGLNGPEDSPLVISAADLLDNDSDVDGDTLTITGVSLIDEIDGFSIELDEKDNTDPHDDEIIITPAADYSGPVNFEYTVSDGTDAVTGEATANFVPVADAPLLLVSAWGSGDGTPVAVTSEFRVNTATADIQINVANAALHDGGSVVVWTSFNGDFSESDIFGHRFDANGDPVDSQFQVNTTVTDQQRYPAVAALGDAGGFIVVWTSLVENGSGNYTNRYVYAQRYDDYGTPTGPEFQITEFAAGETVTELGNGIILITWTPNDGNGVFGQLYSPVGWTLRSRSTRRRPASRTAPIQRHSTMADL